jgi:predicted DNA-binding transcriptional regulator YafY
MAATSSRTLRLLTLLQGRRFWSGSELSGRLEVSLRTLRRDVDRLRDLGYPVEARPGVDGGYSLAPGAALPPLVLDDDEAVALAVGLQSAAQAPVAGMAESSVQALAKVVQVMPARLRRRVDALRAVTVPAGWGAAAPAVDPGVLTTVALACRDGERLRFAYTAADGSRTERHVEPFRLVSSGRRWYLVAYDVERGAWRSFRLDRLSAPSGTGARFAPRRLPAEDAAAFVRDGIDAAVATVTVGARVTAPADQVRQKIGRWATVAADGPGRCRVTMAAENLDWAVFALGVTGSEIDEVHPPELLEHLHAWGSRLASATAAEVRPDGSATLADEDEAAGGS